MSSQEHALSLGLGKKPRRRPWGKLDMNRHCASPLANSSPTSGLNAIAPHTRPSEVVHPQQQNAV
jgi:hypothetical protein